MNGAKIMIVMSHRMARHPQMNNLKSISTCNSFCLSVMTKQFENSTKVVKFQK